MKVQDVLTVDDYGAVRRARRDGKAIRQIAREFGHSRKTIRKILSQAEPNHIGLAIRALVRLTWVFFETGISQYELNRSILRNAVRKYRRKPVFKIRAFA